MNRSGINKEFRQRGFIPENTVVTLDNITQILLTQTNITRIGNHVAKMWGRPLSQDEYEILFTFMKGASGTDYYGKPLAEAMQLLARDFVIRANTIRRGMTTDDIPSTGPEESSNPGLAEYQKKELFQFTDDENQFKYTTHSERRGNAVIDRERSAGLRGSPNNISGNRPVTSEETYKALFDVSHMIMKALDPASVEQMFHRIQSLQTTYYNINLPHQIVPLDSRGRRPTGNNAIYTWNINVAGRPGVKGDLWVQDTIQQDIQMKIYPFWIPSHKITSPAYRKIRMLINEFKEQSVRASEFLGANQDTEVNFFHFELEIREFVGNRAYLVPVEDTFLFRRVMAQVNTITISFRTPFAVLDLEPDSGVFSITAGNPTLFTTTIPHNLDTGDLIYVQNSASTSSAVDALLNQVIGHFVTVLTPLTFTIPVNSTGSGAQTDINVYYGSKRITLDLEFTQVEQ